MSTVAVLFALLVASYLGALLLGSPGRASRLASGVVWILAGFTVGPSGLAVVSRPIMETLTPLALVGVGWLALGAGLRFGVGARRVRPGVLAVAALGTLGTAAAVAGVVAAALPALAMAGAPTTARERLLVAAAAGLACAQTALRRGPRSAAGGQARGRVSQRRRLHVHRRCRRCEYDVRRLGAPLEGGELSPLAPHLERQLKWAAQSELLAGAAAGGDFAIVLGAAVLVGCLGAPEGRALASYARAGAELAGLALGALAAVLLRHRWRQTRALGVLFGTSLVAIGLSVSLRLSILGAAFGLGLALSLLSRHAARLRGLATASEMPVLIPVLLLAGARLDPRAAPWIWAAAGAAVAAHVVAKASFGRLLAAVFLGARRGESARAVELAASSTLATSFSLVVAIALPGHAAAVALSAAAAALAGDILAPLAVRAVTGRVVESGAEADAARETSP